MTKPKLNRNNIAVETHKPIKVVQFGEGNFLRAFVDYAFHTLNKKQDFNGSIAVVQPIEKGMVNMLNEQDGLYTLFSNGIVDGREIREKHLITCIQKCIDPYKNYSAYLALAREEKLQYIISNTTEAGIVFNKNDKLSMQPPNAFPAKLTALLYERYRYFEGNSTKGVTIIPCELINYNADTLKSVILKYTQLWNLEKDFIVWLNKANTFHNTLVDRIVPGYPKDEIQSYTKKIPYQDNLIVTAEQFFLWIIEGNDVLREKLPFHKTSLNVKIVEDMQPYRTQKVCILNGAHTALVPLSLLYGNETVQESIEDKFTGTFVEHAIFEEIIPTLELDRAELETFAHAVLDRFRNPFIKHYLASIALNSISKFKVRVLPSLLQFQKNYGKLPPRLVFSLACLIRFYKGTWNGKPLPVQDEGEIIMHFKKIWSQNTIDQVIDMTLANSNYWGQDLRTVPKLSNNLAISLNAIENQGVEKGFQLYMDNLRINAKVD